ncbi:prolyl oligopeptidase family serine peptidase [Rhizobium gallicum]|nr:prolyl oligopeptidase family serine peptidase [Rhizobium gallicum]
MRDKSLQPPLPHAEPRIRVLHEDVTIDSYGWLRERENPDVSAYLQAENAYAEQAIAHLAGLKADLISEINGRRACNGSPPPFQVGPFEYFRRQAEEKPHPVWCRRPVSGGPTETVLDPNTFEGTERFYTLGAFEPSDDGRYIAYSLDIIGNERYELRIRDTVGGHDVWRDTGRAGRVVWAADNQTIFFMRERADRRHHDQIVRLNVADRKPRVIFEEVNERLALLIRRSQSGAWLFIDAHPTSDYSLRVQQGAAETWCLRADEPVGTWQRLFRRDIGHNIYAEHWHDCFLFRVDDAGPNCRLVSVPLNDWSAHNWNEVVPHREDVRIEEIHVLEKHIIVLERQGLVPRIASRDIRGQIETTIIPEEPSCTLTVGLSAGGRYSVAKNAFSGSSLIYTLGSFVTPDTVIEHNLIEDRSTNLYRPNVPGYDSTQYEATVVVVKSEDGIEVPISLVMRRDRKGPGPVLLNVYGCYGISRWPSFFPWPSAMAERLSLLDRGVAFGIVHVRGGGELGRAWHQAATRDRKQTTYTDLIAAAEGLVDQGIASRDSIVIEGKSAGGGTVLTTASLRPDLFRAVIAEVPVADILDTELDFTLPYALQETAEYGDPHIAPDFKYLRGYDPYYNLSGDRHLPPTYIDGALDDGQVLYFQPARYVAQRRSLAADRDPKLIFRTLTVGGHYGSSHGPGVTEEAAFRIAWTLDQFERSRPE